MVLQRGFVLPQHLENLEPLSDDLPKWRYEWMGNEEIARILLNFDRHSDWMTEKCVHRPENGRVLMFNRKKVKYRQDLYIWKTKRKSKWPREDHVKLKVNSVSCITAIYVHSDILPTFHRRCYWFIQNPDVVLVHYLNHPYRDDDVSSSIRLNAQCNQWRGLAKEELLQQLRPMLSNMPWPRPSDAPLAKEVVEEMANQMANEHFKDLPSQLFRAFDGSHRSNGSRFIRPKLSASSDGGVVPTQPGLMNLSSDSARGAGGQTPNYVLAPAGSVASNGNAIIILNQTAISKCLMATPSRDPAANLRVAHLPEGGSPQQKPTLMQEAATAPPKSILSAHLSPLQAYDPINRTASNISQLQQRSPFSLVEHSPLQQVLPSPTIPSISQPVSAVSTPLTSSFECPPPLPHHNQSPLAPTSWHHPALPSHPVSTSTTHASPPASDYGVKDLMVPTCHGAAVPPHFSPFVDEASTDLTGLDVFDVECLFNASNSVQPDSVESISDHANSSTESAVGDLFPNNFWNTDAAGGSQTTPGALLSPSPPDGLQSAPAETTSSAIVDYSPDWSYTEGGVKVLLTGTWSGAGSFMCRFGEVFVPATPVQEGVLRCYCPAHNAGHVELSVMRDGLIVTCSVKFEYKPVPEAYRDMETRWLRADDDAFKMSILERLERMEQRLNSMGGARELYQGDPVSMNQHYLMMMQEHGMTSSECPPAGDFEQRLCRLCRELSRRFDEEPVAMETTVSRPRDGMTILHYAAALGYASLLATLRALGMESDNEFLSAECNPARVDRYHCSPLMWAAATGRVQCVDLLCGWSPSSVHRVDALGRSPAALAFQRGHNLVAARLESDVVEDATGSDEGDDADVSSIGDTTVSSALDTIDSGEDSMETDASSIDRSTGLGEQYLPPFTLAPYQAGPGRAEDSCQLAWPSEGAEESFSPSLEAADSLLEIRDECSGVTSLAEQIVEATPEQYKQGEASDLTLRSLPYYVNSRCGGRSYSSQGMYRRGIPMVCHMDWSEFLQLPPRATPPEPRFHPNSLEFESLRLTEHEQRQLYIAARTVLDACRHEGIPLRSEVARASLLIQRCYRQYKKFALSKKMNEAAVLIQSKFRSYQEQKRFQRSRHAAILIQSFYRSYKGARTGRQQQAVRLLEDALRSHMTRRHHQAARKIQRFLRLRSDAC